MKKLIISLLTLAALSASAQPFTSQDFLNVQAIYVTNTLAITNLTLNDQGTNIAGTAFTNNSGTLTVVSGANGTYDDNLLKDAVLWADREGRWYKPNNLETNVAVDYIDQTEAPMNVSVLMAGGSGANAAVTFTFAPIWDDENNGTFVGSHDSAERWAFSFTATTTTALSRSTNVPAWRWPGAKGLRLLRVVNADTDATSHVIIQKIKLNGYMP